MKQLSRFRNLSTLAQERINAFVALDNLTSQMPLIEMLRKQRRIRIWVSYDLARECGTYIDAHFNGQVVCVTRYASGHTVEKVNRPPDKDLEHAKGKPRRFHTKSKSSVTHTRSKKAKGVHGRTQHART